MRFNHFAAVDHHLCDGHRIVPTVVGALIVDAAGVATLMRALREPWAGFQWFARLRIAPDFPFTPFVANIARDVGTVGFPPIYFLRCGGKAAVCVLYAAFPALVAVFDTKGSCVS